MERQTQGPPKEEVSQAHAWATPSSCPGLPRSPQLYQLVDTILVQAQERPRLTTSLPGGEGRGKYLPSTPLGILQ